MYEFDGGAPAAFGAAPNRTPRRDATPGVLTRARHALWSDDRLARLAAKGDVGAFEAIFQRYRDDLYRFCVGILREPQDAQDAVQNTMVKAMRALPGERREMRLKPWLYRIAHNEAVELRRRERPVEELPEAVGDVAAGTEERAERNGRLQTLLADIADLPERQRAALVMREMNGLGFGEIGDALSTSPGAVRQALYEARRGLAEMDDGRAMRCDAATRLVSDADGRPRDRGVRAHLRDCSSCRRFQTEIRERGRALTAVAPMPALAAAGALNAALGGAGAAAGGSGTGVGVGLATGSLGASTLVKPAVGLLTVLAIGTAAVDHNAIREAIPLRTGAGDPAKAAGVPADAAARPVARGAREPGDARARHRPVLTPRRSVAAVADRHGVPTASDAHGVAGQLRHGGSAVADQTAAVEPTVPLDRAGVPTSSPAVAAPGPGATATEVPHPVGSTRPADPVHVETTAGAEAAEGAARPELPEQTAQPEAGEGEAAGREGARQTEAVERPERPAHPEHPTRSEGAPPREAEPTEATLTSAPANAPATAETEALAHVPPGQAKKQAEAPAEARTSEAEAASEGSEGPGEP